MGQNNSSQDEIPFDLPQQQIISMVDGQAVANTAPSADGGARPNLNVGSSKHAHAVKSPLSLPRGALQLSRDGVVTIQVQATVDGVIAFFKPALEHVPERSPAGEDPDVHSDVSWPTVRLEGGGQPRLRRISKAERCSVCFDHPSESLLPADRHNRGLDIEANGVSRWPLVLVLLPGLGVFLEEDRYVMIDAPPDGTLMVYCIVKGGELQIARQLIAWGGRQRAFVVKELYGINEAQQPAAAQAEDSASENVKNCVVCLTVPKDTALMPCGHFCVCYDCGASIRLTPMRNRCPLCRQDVHDIVRINVSSSQVAPSSGDASSSMPVVASGNVGGSSPSVDAANAVDVAQPQSGSLANSVSDSAAPTPTPEAAQAAASVPTSSYEDKHGDNGRQSGVSAPAVQPSAAEMRAARLKALEQRSAALPEGQTATSTVSGDPGGPTDSPPAASVAAQLPGTAADKHTSIGDPDRADGQVSTTSASSSNAASSAVAALPPRCLQRLTREMKQMEQQKAKNFEEHGLELSLADPEGNDLRVWTLYLYTDRIDPDSQLGKQLRKWNVPAIAFEVWIPDGFPTSPPKVRVLRPTFSLGSFYVHQYGALCLEILTRQGWSPATSLVQLGVALKNMMSQGSGSVICAVGSVTSGSFDRRRAWEQAEAIEKSHTDWVDDPLSKK